MTQTPLLSVFVKQAAQRALDEGRCCFALPWVPEGAERDVVASFRRATLDRGKPGEKAAAAGRAFVATVLRRSGVPRLSPRALPWRHPLARLAEDAVGGGDVSELKRFVLAAAGGELERRFERVTACAAYDPRSVADARRFVAALSAFTEAVDAIVSLAAPAGPVDEIASLLRAWHRPSRAQTSGGRPAPEPAR